MDRRDTVSRTLAALADPTRRQILERLTEGEAGVVELAHLTSLSQPAITKHLKVLEDAGLVGRERDAQRRPAHLRSEGLEVLERWLQGTRRQWNERLDRLDEHLAITSNSKENREGTT